MGENSFRNGMICGASIMAEAVRAMLNPYKESVQLVIEGGIIEGKVKMWVEILGDDYSLRLGKLHPFTHQGLVDLMKEYQALLDEYPDVRHEAEAETEAETEAEEA